MDKQDHTQFSGTYFEKDVVLRLGRWTRFLGWAILTIYFVQFAFDLGLNIYYSQQGGYPLDFSFVLNSFSRPFQGAMIFVILHVLAQALLILLDIEDNTRRAARK
jgi:hypothetical protein